MVTPQSVLSLSLGFHIAFIPSRLRPPVFRLGYVVSLEEDDNTEIDSDSNAPVDKAPETREKRWI